MKRNVSLIRELVNRNKDDNNRCPLNESWCPPYYNDLATGLCLSHYLLALELSEINYSSSVIESQDNFLVLRGVGA